VNSVHPAKEARSAIAPETRATAMIAKQAWKATKTRAGMVKTAASGLISPCSPKYCSGSPMKPRPPTELPKAME
jgi:hypothetical protein